MRSNPGRLQRWGVASWCLLGIIALVVVIALGLGAVSGIVIPLVVAVILGTVLVPVVEFLQRRGLRPAFAALTALVVALLVAVGLIALVVWGFLQQLPEIARQLNAGWASLVQWVASLNLDVVWFERARSTFEAYAPKLSQGVLGALSSTFAGTVSFAMGTFFAVFFLFFVLRDGHKLPDWLARSLALDTVLVNDVATIVQQSLRGYFRGIAVTAVITAPVFMVPVLLLRVPLALPIFVLYLFTSFIPFVGAWLTGAFAVLIAFGSGGAPAALIVAVALLISNGTIESVVSSWALGSSLKIHPVVVLLSTLIGGTVAGLIGMVLGAPLVATLVRSLQAIREHAAAGESAGGTDSAATG